MIKHKHNILLSLAALLFGVVALGGCTNDFGAEKVEPKTNGILLNFGTPDGGKIDVQTRAYNLDYVDEHRVLNMYVYIFDSSGDKVYSRYFDNSNKEATAEAVRTATTDCWYVNNSDDSGVKTSGVINIHTTVDEYDTYQIYAITNLDADMVDISSDRLSQVQTEDELLAVQGRIRDAQQTLSRNAALQMSGAIRGVYIKEIGGAVKITTDAAGNNTAILKLYHMDAKVHVTLIQGVDVKELTNAEIKVVNVPRSGYVFRYEDRQLKDAGDNPLTITASSSGYDAGQSADDFFDYGFVSFDEEQIVSTDIGGGATENRSHYEAYFYMLENRRTPTAEIASGAGAFFERDRQAKHVGGLADGHNVVNADGTRDFMYANDLSTYMVIKATIAMNLEDDAVGKELGGDVEYIIHLGDFANDVNDYNTNRNTSYHYTVTVNGAHNIRVEVEMRDEATVDGKQPGENQPSAMGSVVVAKEEIAVCDCHYVNKTLTFHARNVEPQLTWCVSTPFGEGQPVVDEDFNEILIPPGLDYEWVHFRLNKMSDDDIYYEQIRQPYTIQRFNPAADPEDENSAYYGLMNVSQLVKFVKDQKKLYLEGLDPSDPENLISTLSAFDKDPAGPKICVTVFVDEFYYDYDPTGMYSEETLPVDFWKQFVNAPKDRYMYILSDSNLSRDQESTATGSVITIQQHPIQTIYDTTLSAEDLPTAWGIEREDEYEKFGWSYNGVTSESQYNYKRPYTTNDRNSGNTDQDNGRLNSIKEWDLYDTNSAINSKSWSEYVDFEVENDLPELVDSKHVLRYSCLTRNRDNDGDGLIDQDEIRWYMASIRQLIGMVVGQGLLKFDSRLYNRNNLEQSSSYHYDWRQHTISSTATGDNSNNPIVVWGEEATSTGDLGGSWNYSGDTNATSGGDPDNRVTSWTIRCVRNLGTKNETKQTGFDLTEMPASYVKEENNDAFAEDGAQRSITCVYLDDRALRAQSSIELPFTDERREVNRLSKKFYLAESVGSLPTGYDYDTGYSTGDANLDTFPFIKLNSYITSMGGSYVEEGGAVKVNICPKGYRLPNQIELLMMMYYHKDKIEDYKYTPCRTYWSFGVMGSQKVPTASGWTYDGNFRMYDKGNLSAPRCVRDATLDELAAAGLL